MFTMLYFISYLLILYEEPIVLIIKTKLNAENYFYFSLFKRTYQFLSCSGKLEFILKCKIGYGSPDEKKEIGPVLKKKKINGKITQ